MNNSITSDRRAAVRRAAWLLLVGQLLYVAITLLHADGEANNHPAVFAEYAASDIWTLVHVAQFACTAIFVAGLLALFLALEGEAEGTRWIARFGAVSTVVAFALYGAVLAVDGVALKQAVDAWASAPEAEKVARFASAETVRWIEWGMRSCENFALGLAVLVLAVAVLRTAWMPRPIAFLVGLSGLTDWQAGQPDPRDSRQRTWSGSKWLKS